MYGMVLAAGFGTRLGELSTERPKPLLPVCDVPLVRWAASLLVHHGIRELGVNLHHLGPLVRQELGDGSDIGATIAYSVEEDILGTGGGIKQLARRHPRDTCVVVNGKIVTDVDLRAAIAHHRATGALATMVLFPVSDPERWGAIGVDERGQLVRLIEARRPGQGASADFMFTGIHVLEPAAIAAIPDGPCCIIRTAYSELFARGAPLAGYVHRGYFFEHSTPQRYLQGNFNLLEQRVDPPARPGPLHGVHPGARIAGDAQLIEPLLVGASATIGAGARVGPRVVVGTGSEVAPEAIITDSVIWPGAAVSGPTHRCIVTPGQTLRVSE